MPNLPCHVCDEPLPAGQHTGGLRPAHADPRICRENITRAVRAACQRDIAAAVVDRDRRIALLLDQRDELRRMLIDAQRGHGTALEVPRGSGPTVKGGAEVERP